MKIPYFGWFTLAIVMASVVYYIKNFQKINKTMSYKKAVKQKFKKSWCMDMSTNTEKRYWIMDGVLHETLPVGYFPTKITNPIGKFLSEGKTPAKAWEAAAKLVFSSTEP